jgi:hypothetical protein
MSDLALSPPRLNTPDAVNHLLTRHGIRVTEKTLKTWAWRGGGPEFQKSGPHRLYPVERLDIWASQRLTPIVSKTSELTSLLTDVAPNTAAKRVARVGTADVEANPAPAKHECAKITA